MRLEPVSGTVVMRGEAQWTRCRFERTALVDGAVTLAWAPPEASKDPAPCTVPFAGIAVDPHCRIFHPVADAGRIEYLLWGKQTALRVAADAPQPFDLHGKEDGFGNIGPLPARPVALACDEASYLYVADAKPPAVWLVDTWQHDVARREDLDAVPLDLVHRAGKVHVLLEDGGYAVIEPCAPVERANLGPAFANAARIDVVASADGAVRRFLLLDAGTAAARVRCVEDDRIVFTVPFCTDFVIAEDDDPDNGRLFVFALRPGEDFRRFRLLRRAVNEIDGLHAPQYAGDGIAWAPDGRIAYWTPRGVRHASPAKRVFEANGSVSGFALDGHFDRNAWGRVLVEACIPDGTRVRLRCYTRDELDFTDPVARDKPANYIDAPTVELPDSTPLRSASWDDSTPDWQPLFRDDAPHPLVPAPARGFMRYDAPVIAEPGRFLWIELLLEGTRSKTPQVRSLRAEWPRHGLLRQLPKTLWREPRAAEFLGRYLMPEAAVLDEWGAASGVRHRLLDARIAPAEALEWLGSWLGLAMDGCWPESARRRMLLEVSALFRIRGTVEGLRRMVAILSGGEVTVVELFRLRSGGVAGNEQARISRGVLGGGYRVGGAIGADRDVTLEAGAERPFEDYAHRFTVMVAAQLDEEQLRCLRRLVETHKPAHTMFELCAMHSGTRVGVGLHAGLGAAIGKGSGFAPVVVSDVVLGKGYLVGRAPLDEASDTGGCWT